MVRFKGEFFHAKIEDIENLHSSMVRFKERG